MLQRTYEDIEIELQDRLWDAYIDILEASQKLSKPHDLEDLPTIAIYKDFKVTYEFFGDSSDQEIVRNFPEQKHLNKWLYNHTNIENIAFDIYEDQYKVEEMLC